MDGKWSVITFILRLSFLERCAPFLLCEACLLYKRQGTLELVLSGTESCIVITCEGIIKLSIVMKLSCVTASISVQETYFTTVYIIQLNEHAVFHIL